MSNELDFVFVILHYNTVDDTNICVESIRKHICLNSYKIIIVDNASPNKSGDILVKRYFASDDVLVILNDSNLGFARGNNVGFKYAKKVFKAKFIVLMNNDTQILYDDFVLKINDEYNKSHCALIGPKIITPNPPFDSNPGSSDLPRIRDLFINQIIIYIYMVLSYFNLDDFVHRKFGRQEKKRLDKVDKNNDERKENVKLHGCFWVFTPNYISKFDGINSKTFLYNEEPLLFLRCIKYNLKTVYLPELVVFHKEDSSTNSINFKGEVFKRRFVYKHLIKSKWILIAESLKYKFYTLHKNS